MVDHTADRKAALRREAQVARAAAHRAASRAETVAPAGQAMAELFWARLRDRLSPRTVVSLYCPIRDEIDVGALVETLVDAGIPTALPVMQGAQAPLMFRRWRPGDTLIRRAFGVGEPDAGAVVRPDILVVPLLAFDIGGNRLGYGGGYYDRTLADLRAAPVLAVGVAYDEQEFPSVPVQQDDQKLDMIVTDRRVIDIGPA